MNKPYSDEQLKVDVVRQELEAVELEGHVFTNRLQELVSSLGDYSSFETITRLKIDDYTSPIELVKFAEMCGTMTNGDDYHFEIEYGTGIAYKHLKPYKEREVEVINEEIYRRRDANRKWEKDQADEKKVIKELS